MAMMRAVIGSVVLYPSDAVARKTRRANGLHKGVAVPAHVAAQDAGDLRQRRNISRSAAQKIRRKPGDKVTVVGAGVTLLRSVEGRRRACENEGIGITVIDAYSIKPLGKDVILAAAQKTEQHSSSRWKTIIPKAALGDAVAGELSVDGIKVHKLAIRRTAAFRQTRGIAREIWN
jgi:transketolase